MVYSISKLLILMYFLNYESLARPMQNLSEVKADIPAYQRSDPYLSDIKRIVQKAQLMLAREIDDNDKSEKKEKLAILLGVDETAVSNYHFLKRYNFNYKALTVASNHYHELPIVPIRNLYRYALANHVAVFFASDRPESMRQVTRHDLQNAGYHHWNKLYLGKNGQHNITSFERRVAYAIKNQDYHLVLNIGSQCRSVLGVPADYHYKIPGYTDFTV